MFCCQHDMCVDNIPHLPQYKDVFTNSTTEIQNIDIYKGVSGKIIQILPEQGVTYPHLPIACRFLAWHSILCGIFQSAIFPGSAESVAYPGCSESAVFCRSAESTASPRPGSAESICSISSQYRLCSILLPCWN